MKRTILLSALAIMILGRLFAQAPLEISHQAVIRGADGKLVTNETVGVKVSILQGSESGTVVYSETHAPESNANGLISYIIGHGDVVEGVFVEIDWSDGPYFLKTEVDPAGGSNYTITGTTQFLSVPYSIFAGKSGDQPWNKSGTDISYQSGKVGIGTTNPTQALDINGQLRIQGGTPATGRVLTSDSNGNASWEDLPEIEEEDPFFRDNFDFNGPLTGEFMYFSGNSWANFPKGVDGQILSMSGSQPTWSNLLVTCPEGYTTCSGICVNLTNDRYNCGNCGHQCPSGHICVNGNCVVNCQAGLTDCGGNCVKISSDPDNCGGCGIQCPTGYACLGGSCVQLCP